LSKLKSNNANIREKEQLYTGIDLLLENLEVLIARRIIVIVIFFSVIFSTIVYLLLTPSIYIAETTLLPAETGRKSPLESLSGVTQLIGLNLSSADDLSTLYQKIIMSRRLIRDVLTTRFNSVRQGKILPLLDILEIEGEEIEERLDVGYKLLINNIVEVEYSKEFKITTISIATKEPQLSSDIANSIVEKLDRFSRNLTIKKAKENKYFIESRLEETSELLDEAEEELRNFRESNKRIENSPDLQLEQGRLIREIRIQEEVYLTLKKELEIIKIEEVKNMPTIRVLDTAIAPVNKSRPERRKIMAISIFFALTLGIAVPIGQQYLIKFYANSKNALIIQKSLIPLIEDYNMVKKKFNNLIGR